MLLSIGQSITKLLNHRLIELNYRFWKDRVIQNKLSLFNRTRKLSSILRESRLHRSMNSLNLFCQVSLQKKAIIEQHLMYLEKIITTHPSQNFSFGRIKEFAEHKTLIAGKISQLCLSFEHHLKSMVKQEAIQLLKRNQRVEGYRDVINSQKRLRLLRNSLIGLKKFVIELVEPSRRIQGQKDKSIIASSFKILKEKTLTNKESLWNRAKCLQRKLKLQRIRFALKKLKMNKDKNSLKLQRHEQGLKIVRIFFENSRLGLLHQFFSISQLNQRLDTFLNTVSLQVPSF